MNEDDLFYARNAEGNLRVGVIAGAIVSSSIYILVLISRFRVHMVVVVCSSVVRLVAIGSSAAATAARIVSIVTSSTSVAATTVVPFLIERHPAVLIVGALGLVGINKVHQHVVGLARGLGIFVNAAYEVVLSVGDQRPISLAICMCEEHHGKILLADGENHACSSVCIFWVVAVLNDPLCHV
jgi:hypothetical protein